MAISLGRKLGLAIKMETVYGTAPSMNYATDAMLAWNQQNPVDVNTTIVNVTPIRASFTNLKDIIGRQLYTFKPEVFVQGPENLATGTPWRASRLLRACGLQETINGVSSIIYTPRSSNFESVAIEAYPDGFKHIISGCYGTFVMDALAAQGFKCTFDMKGLYNGPTVAAIPALTYEPQKTVAFVSAAATIAGVTIVLKHFTFTYAGVIDERLDANAANGLAGLIPTSRNPTVVMEVETDTALRNYFSDLSNSTTVALNCQIGTVSGNRVKFQFPSAQLEQIPYGLSNNIRTQVLTFNIQSGTDEGELSVIFD